MFCEKCGQQLEDASRFCPYCGAANDSAEPAVAAAPAPAPETPPAPAKPGFFSKKKNIVLFSVISAVVILAIVAVCILTGLPTTIYMDDFIRIEYSGMSTQASAYITVDSDLFSQRLLEEMTEAEMNVMLSRMAAAGVTLSLDKTDDLSNGDSLFISFYMDNDIAKDYGVKFELQNTDVLVSGLQEPVYLDLFADLKLVYTGCSPYSQVFLENNSENDFIRDYVSYSINNSYDLEEGETFTVEAYFSQYTANDMGYIILETTKEYTAANLPQPLLLDPFDYVDVTFSGLEGNGRANCQKYTDEVDFMYYINFEFNKRSSLIEGDIITLSYTVSGNRDPLQYGCTLTEGTTKEYTVPKLGSYLTSIDQLTTDEQQKIIDKATEVAKLYLTKESATNMTGSMYLDGTGFTGGNNLSHAENLSNVTLHSVILAKPNQWYSYNYLYFVFTVDITNHPNITENDGNAVAAIYMTLSAPIARGDGTLEVDYESSYIFSVDNDVYLSYDALYEDYLKNLYEPTVVTPTAE